MWLNLGDHGGHSTGLLAIHLYMSWLFQTYWTPS
jgi:hypothetical protein